MVATEVKGERQRAVFSAQIHTGAEMKAMIVTRGKEVTKLKKEQNKAKNTPNEPAASSFYGQY